MDLLYKVVASLILMFFCLPAMSGELFDEYIKSNQNKPPQYNLFEDYVKKENQPNNFQEYEKIFKDKKLERSVSGFLKQIKKGNMENVKLYIEAGMNPNDNYYLTYPLDVSVKKNNYEITKFLLECGADPNLSRDSLLYKAISKRKPKMFKLLLDFGADYNYKHYVTNKTLIEKAIEMNQKEIIQMLLDKNVRLTPKDKYLLERKKYLP